MLASVQTHNVFVRVQKITWDCVFPENIPTTPTTAAIFELWGKWGWGVLQRGNLKSFGGYFTIGQVACIVEVVNSLKLPDWFMSLNWPYKILGFDNSWGLIISIIFMILAEFMSYPSTNPFELLVRFLMSVLQNVAAVLTVYSRAFHKPFINTHRLLKFCDSCEFSQVFVVLLRFFYKAFAYF